MKRKIKKVIKIIFWLVVSYYYYILHYARLIISTALPVGFDFKNTHFLFDPDNFKAASKYQKIENGSHFLFNMNTFKVKSWLI